MNNRLAVLVVVLFSLCACNEGRGTPPQEVADEADAAAQDASGDAVDAADVQPDVISVDVGESSDLGGMDTTPIDVADPDIADSTDSGPTDSGPTDSGPTDSGPTDSGPTDVAPDSGEPVGVPLVAYVVTVAGQQRLEVVPVDASAPPRELYRSAAGDDAAYPAFSPAGDRIAFLTVSSSNQTRVGVIDTDGASPANFLTALDGAQVLAVDWYGDETLAVTMLVDVMPGVTVVFASLSTGAIDGSLAGASGGQVLSVHTTPAVMGQLTLEKPVPPLGELWYDGARGRGPEAVTDGLPIAGDVSLINEGQFIFTDSEPALYRAAWSPDTVTTEAARVTPEGVQDYHPRPLQGGDYYVSARFREGEPARPAPRDIVLVDGVTGLRLWTITDTPVRYERHPDVQTHLEWRP